VNAPALPAAVPRWLIAGFGFLFVLVVLVAAASLHYLGSLRSELENVAHNELRRLSQAHELRMIIRERILTLDRIFLEDDPFDRDASYLHFLDLGNRFIAIRRALESQAVDAEERRILADFRDETIAATPPIEAVVERYLAGQVEEGRHELLRVAIPAQSRVIATSDAVHTLYSKRGEAAVTHARRVYDAAFWTVLGLGSVVLLLTLLTAVLITRRILRDRTALLAEIGVRRNTEDQLRALSNDLELLVATRTARLQETTALLEEAQRIGQMGHWELDIPSGKLVWSAQVYRLFGQSPGSQNATYEAFLEAVHPDDREKVVAAVAQGLSQGDYQVKHRIRWPDGSVRHVQEMARVTYDANGQPARMVGTVQDITDAQLLQTRLWDMAHHDGLTGLPNRSLLLDHLQQSILLAQRQESTLAVALIDLDRFKEANDTLGHAAGDRLLEDVAKRLRSSVRQSDIVSRFAGDEFVVIFPDTGTAEQVDHVLNKVLASLRAPCVLNGVDWQITASIGVAFYPRDGQDTRSLLQAADEAMYDVKQSTRDAYRLYGTPQD
jgi:diguanylate cyclase (GGDEF)-like protein/PAS domain S-box-containing protein